MSEKTKWQIILKHLAQVVSKVNNAICQINHYWYPMDIVVCFVHTVLSTGWRFILWIALSSHWTFRMRPKIKFTKFIILLIVIYSASKKNNICRSEDSKWSLLDALHANLCLQSLHAPFVAKHSNLKKRFSAWLESHCSDLTFHDAVKNIPH